MLPEGIDRTEEAYKREILKLRIENERLKNYMFGREKMGQVCSLKNEFEIFINKGSKNVIKTPKQGCINVNEVVILYC